MKNYLEYYIYKKKTPSNPQNILELLSITYGFEIISIKD